MWATEIDAYCTWLQAAGRSAGTVRLRRHYLGRLAAELAGSPWSAEPEQLVRFLAVDGWAPETRKSARASITGFYHWGVQTGRIAGGNDPARLLPSVSVPVGVPRPAPDHVLARALLAAGPGQYRLMVQLAAWHGLRRGEIARVHTSDVVGDHLLVHGKGGRRRLVPLVPETLEAIEACGPGWVFPGRLEGAPITADAVGHILRRLLGAGWSGHTLRHRFATRAYAAERDLLTVQRLLGHAKSTTTERYVDPPAHARRTAVLAAAG